MAVKIRTIKDIRPYLAKELGDIYPEPEISALTSIIIRNIYGISRLHRLALPESPVSKKQVQRIISICMELRTGKPVQYILGETSFYNCVIRVNSETLIPRSETEELVDLIIKENRGFTGTILDVGTGTGCIAIALAVNIPGSVITGIDISEGAIKIAKENARLNSVKVTLIIADIFNAEFSLHDKTDIIVSNPPYIRESEKQFIAKNVLDFEPHMALFVPDSDPLIYYREIVRFAVNILKPGGKIYFEINEAMGKSIFQLLESSGYSGIEIVKDINGKERIIKGIKND
ncbi:MAG: peptide chain release factor N(5)-glutamine methyltransferase [Bacteroidales bacterium]|nr:peptide chain release factor N(5)-glutamine methyltransferase [Bacteroidales bacterium]